SETSLEDVLCKLGLENCFPGRITLSTFLEIGSESITDKPIQALKKLPWCFLKRLMMVNVTARSTKCSAAETDTDSALQDLDSVLELIDSNDYQESNTINPLDLITAPFLCSDSFLQQEMMSKTLMCQFHIHRDVECGDVTQRIANGLVEIDWCLPCGKNNLDIFSEPVAVANLRGDLLSFQKQFSILCQTSSAVFIFFDSIVDEDCTECQNAKRSAAETTSRINNVVRYQEDQLPLQGKLWKELTKIEKEECRLQKAGDQPIEEYKYNLQSEKQKLRQQQSSKNISEAMECFITAISSESKEERSYFLKWMRMNLDVTAQKKLSGLRDEYKKKCCKLSESKVIVADLDRQTSNSSLGMEHFIHEMGQLYEAACSLPDNSESRQQFEHLPSLGADLLLDGFPLELLDGDTSNIPHYVIPALQNYPKT
ncbi:URGCP protein, partial [Polyodon spathula]|nr:URGCP protein [Polyodon spathula]